MKRLFVIPAVIALAFVCSCNKEQEVDNPDIKDDVQTGVTEFRATLQATKTQLGAPTGAAGSREWPNLWSDGDVINVNGVESAALSTGDGYVGTDYAVFHMASAVSGPYYAAYPASAVSEYSAGGATITIPAAQSFVEGNYDPAAYIMIGKSDTPTLSFSPMMGIIQLTTTAPAEGTLYIKSISVEPVGDENMSGVFTTTENYAGITGGTTPAITISAASGTTKTFGTVFTFAVPAMNYASGVRFRITAVPNANGTGTEQTMVFAKQSAFDVAAGTLYPLTAPAFKASAITVSCPFKTSSSAGLSWSGANASNQNNFKKAWRVAVYSDIGCNTLVVQHDIPADPNKSGVWSGLSANGNPHFMIGGLSAGTTYYAIVTDIQNNTSSAPFEFTTDPFTVVEASSPVGNTLVAEDFSEFGWGPAYLGGNGGAGNRYAGWSPVSGESSGVSLAAPSGKVSTGYYKAYNYSANNLPTNFDYTTAPRFNSGWGYCYQGSAFNGYPQAGHLRLGGANANRVFIVCPALSGITSGKFATVDVTVKVGRMTSDDVTNNPQFAVFIESNLTLSKASQRMYTGGEFNRRYPVSLTKYGRNSQELTFRVNGLQSTDHLMVGCYNNVDQYNRFTLYSIKVEKVSESDTNTFDITDPETLELFHSRVAGGATSLKGNVVNNVDASSIASSWTPITGYTGTLEGNSNTISGLSKPFFDNLQGTVQNLTLESTVSSTDRAQEYTAIFANTLDGGSISNCTASGSVTYRPSEAVNNGTRYVAGFVAYAKSGTLSNCINNASISVPDNSVSNDAIIEAAGLVARLGNGTTSNVSCSYLTNNGAISVGVDATGSHNLRTSVGGVIAYVVNRKSSGPDLNHLTNNGSVEYSGKCGGQLMVGGVVGYIIESSLSTGSDWSNTQSVSVTSTARVASASDINVGGVAGVLSFALTNGTNTGIVSNEGTFSGTAADICIGGITGNNKGNVMSNCKNENTSTITNSGQVSNSGDGSSIFVGGLVGYAKNSTWESCRNVGASVSNSGTADYFNCIGGLVGYSICDSETVEMSQCYNTGAVTNTGKGKSTPTSINTAYDDFSSEVNIGGLAGFLDGQHDLSGDSNDYNYNNGPVTENSASSHVAVGGVVGTSTHGSTTLEYVRNKSNGDISIQDGDNDMTYIGGILAVGCTYCTVDNTTNQGDIVFKGVTSAQAWCGGILGQWHESADRTTTASVSGCTNEGVIKTNGTDHTDFVSKGSSFSYFGGIVGGALADHKNKTYTRCKNTGDISIYCKSICRVGGIAATCQTPPNRCEVRCNITFRRKTNDNGNSSLSHIGGIVGFKQGSGSSSYDYLLYLGTIDAQGGGELLHNYVGGIIGNSTQNTTYTFTSCHVGGTIKGRNQNPATASNNSAPRLYMGSTSSNASRFFTFPNCNIQKGTQLVANSTYTMNQSSDVQNAYCFHAGCALATNGVLPSVVDSIESVDMVNQL